MESVDGVRVEDSRFRLTFPGASTADANRYAADLAGELRQVDEELTVEQARERADTQDFGATLILILGTASVTAIAKGISAWMARHSGAEIHIDADGVQGKNLDSRDAARIAEAFYGRK